MAVMVFICQDGTDLDIFWILIESWDPGLTIREAVRRKIVRPSRKNGQRPRRKIREAREAGRERGSDQVPLSLLSSSHQGSQTAMALGTPPLFSECTWTYFPFSPSVPTLWNCVPLSSRCLLVLLIWLLDQLMTTPGQSFWRQEGVVLGRKGNIPTKSLLFFHLPRQPQCQHFPVLS